MTARRAARLGELRHDEAGAVVALEQRIRRGGGLAGETFVGGVDGEREAERRGRFCEVDLVGGEVFGHAAVGFGEWGVAFDFGGDLGGGRGTAGLVGDVAEVAEGAGDVAFEDGAVEVGGFAAADDVDEVLHVAVGAFEFFHDLARFVVGGGGKVAVGHDAAAFAIDDVADVDAAVVVHAGSFGGAGFGACTGGCARAGFRGEAADFEDERGGGVVVDDDLGVGRVAVVAVAEAAADAEGVAGQAGFAEEPAGDVHLVDALVADVAVAVEVNPVPVVVNGAVFRGVAVGRDEGRGAGPEIVIDCGGNGRGRAGEADAVAAFVAEATGGGDFAEVAGLRPGDGFTEACAGADLRAGLGDAAGFLSGGDELAALPDVVGNGFFDVDIFAGLQGPDAHERVPVVGSGDGDRVEVGRGEELANVGKFFYRDAFFGESGGGAVEDGGVGVADGDDADAFDFAEAAEVVFTATVEADNGDADVGMSADDLAPGAGGESGGGGEQRGVAQKMAARERGEGHGGEVLGWGKCGRVFAGRSVICP